MIEKMTSQLVIYRILLIKKKNRIIGIDLSKQTNLKDTQQINFLGRHLAARKATMLFIIEKSEETTFDFLQNSANII